MECPKCSGKMLEKTLVTLEGKLTIDRCENCSGMWFDTGEEKRLKKEWLSGFLDVSDPRESKGIVDKHDLLCPRCNKKMQTKNDLNQLHIKYEICERDGIFMDAGEFTDFKHNTLLDIFRDMLSYWVIKGNPTS